MNNQKTVIHNGVEYYCEMEGPVRTNNGKECWSIAIFKIDPQNNDTNSFGAMSAGWTEADCLRNLSSIILTLTEWGLPVKEACELAGKAVGEKKMRKVGEEVPA